MTINDPQHNETDKTDITTKSGQRRREHISEKLDKISREIKTGQIDDRDAALTLLDIAADLSHSVGVRDGLGSRGRVSFGRRLEDSDGIAVFVPYTGGDTR